MTLPAMLGFIPGCIIIAFGCICMCWLPCGNPLFPWYCPCQWRSPSLLPPSLLSRPLLLPLLLPLLSRGDPGDKSPRRNARARLRALSSGLALARLVSFLQMGQMDESPARSHKPTSDQRPHINTSSTNNQAHTNQNQHRGRSNASKAEKGRGEQAGVSTRCGFS